MSAYFLLIIAILCEVFGSSMLKATNGFKKLFPSLGVIIGYGGAFYALALTLRTLPIGMAYAIWAGLGTALTALVGIVIYKEGFSSRKLIGIIFIIGGVFLLNVEGVY